MLRSTVGPCFLIHSIYNSLHLLTPNSHSTPPLPLGNLPPFLTASFCRGNLLSFVCTKVIFQISDSLCENVGCVSHPWP